MRTFFVLWAATLLGGCASISNLQMADTLGRGNFQVGVEPGVLGAGSTNVNAAPSSTNPVWLPHIDVSARFGVSEGVDVGLRAGLSFLEFQSKFLFTKPGDPKLAVSLAPTIGGLIFGSGGTGAGVVGLLNIGIPVLIGIKTEGGSEFVIGPRIQNLVLLAGTGGGTVYGLGAGGSLGFAWRISDNFGIMPEVSAIVPVLGASAFASQFQSSSALNAGVVIFQFKLGLLIGRFRPLNGDVKQATPPRPMPMVANPPLVPSEPPPPPPPGP